MIALKRGLTRKRGIKPMASYRVPIRAVNRQPSKTTIAVKPLEHHQVMPRKAAQNIAAAFYCACEKSSDVDPNRCTGSDWCRPMR